MVTILILCANPVDTSPVDLARESMAIESAIRNSPNGASFNIHVHFEVRASDLQALLLRYSPDIVHFAGHGTENGDVILEDSSRHSYVVSPEALVQLFTVFRDQTRCVVLSTTFSAIATKAIAESVDYALGMRGPISDEAAISFAKAFYAALAYGRDIKSAFQIGCMEVKLISSDEYDIPVLISKSQPKLIFTEKPHDPASNETTKAHQKAEPLKKTSYSGILSHSEILNNRKTLGVFVGVNDYDDPFISNLKVCVNDVDAIYQALGQNINARLLCSSNNDGASPTRNNIFTELVVSSQAAEERDLLLFYYSGHGFVEDGESYLVATDTRLSTLKYTAVAVKNVIEIMKNSEARSKIVVIDACHSGAAIGKSSTPFSAEFMAHVFQDSEGIVVLASCKQGEQSWEWPDKNYSVFTHYLLQAIAGDADSEKKGFITISDAYRFLTNSVKTWSKRYGLKQTPTMQAEVVGEIILAQVDLNLGEGGSY